MQAVFSDILQKKRKKKNKMKTKAFCVLIIIALGVLVYLHSVNGEFVWDDANLVQKNVFISGWGHLPEIFTSTLGEGSNSGYSAYRPIQILSYITDRFLWGGGPAGYHLTNIVIHITAAVLVFFLINMLFGDAFLSIVTAVLFVVHPVHVASVAYISGRADSLSACFMMISMVFYVRSISSGDRYIRPLLISLAAFLLAILSKESALIFPGILLVYHYVFRKKIDLKRFMFFPVIMFLYAAGRVIFLDKFFVDPACPTTALQRIPGFFEALSSYVRLIFIPVGLHMEYGDKVFGFSETGVITGIIIVAAAFLYMFLKKGADRRMLFGVCWFFCALIPVANIYPVKAYMAEHWLYFPSIGAFLFIAAVLDEIYRKKGTRIIAILITAGLIVFYSAATIRFVSFWVDPEMLYLRNLKFVPDSHRLYTNLGVVYSSRGRREEAIEAYKKAITLDPDNARAYNNLGNIYSRRGRTEEAILFYNKAIDADADFAPAYYNLALLYFSMKDYDRAGKYCDRAIASGYRADPDFFNELKTYRKRNDRTDQR